MKKIISLILALVLVLGLAVSASATTDTFEDYAGDTHTDNWSDTGNKSTGNVVIEVISGDPIPVYYVTVDWGTLTFVYSAADEKDTWDPINHIYTAAGGNGNWIVKDNGEATITVTNHSSEPVEIVTGFDDNGTKTQTTNNVTATIAISDGVEALATAIGTEVDEAPSVTYDVSVTGTPLTHEASFTLGTITVQINEA